MFLAGDGSTVEKSGRKSKREEGQRAAVRAELVNENYTKTRLQGQASYNDFCREREERKKNQAKTELSIKNIFSPQNLLIYLMK